MRSLVDCAPIGRQYAKGCGHHDGRRAGPASESTRFRNCRATHPSHGPGSYSVDTTLLTTRPGCTWKGAGCRIQSLVQLLRGAWSIMASEEGPCVTTTLREREWRRRKFDVVVANQAADTERMSRLAVVDGQRADRRAEPMPILDTFLSGGDVEVFRHTRLTSGRGGPGMTRSAGSAGNVPQPGRQRRRSGGCIRGPPGSTRCLPTRPVPGPPSIVWLRTSSQ